MNFMKFVSWFHGKVQLSPRGKQYTQIKKYLFLPRHSHPNLILISPNKKVVNLPHAGWEFPRISLYPSGLLNKKISLQYFETSYPTSVPPSSLYALSSFAGVVGTLPNGILCCRMAVCSPHITSGQLARSLTTGVIICFATSVNKQQKV